MRNHDGAVRREKPPAFRRGAMVVAAVAAVLTSTWLGAYLFWGDPQLGAALGAIAGLAIVQAVRRS